MTSITIGSLFSGIGGLDLAVESVTGGRVAWQCERDKYARSVLARHWPGLPIFEDIKKLHDAPAVDALCGGFPCQDISLAGSREGIEHGKKSGLWREFARIIREIRPRYVFLENVAAITTAGLGIVLGDLAACGFDAEWGCLRACDIGAPHIRNRWFLFGWLADGATSRPISDANSEQLRQQRQRLSVTHCQPGAAEPADISPARPRAIDQRRWDNLPTSTIRGGPNGVPGGLDVPKQLRCLGNAVVPQQGAEAFRQLIKRSGQ